MVSLHSFGDIHYFYGPPTNNPPHHRFDKGSYVYLFEDANLGRARLEVANQPGREDQDAFDGCKNRISEIGDRSSEKANIICLQALTEPISSTITITPVL